MHEDNQINELKQLFYETFSSVKGSLRIKDPLMFLFFLLFFVIGLLGFWEQIRVLQDGERVIGMIENIQAENTKCGKSNEYDCLKYEIHSSFITLSGIERKFTVDSGELYGINRNKEELDWKVGKPVKIIYDPDNLNIVYENTFWGIWGSIILLFIFQALTFYLSFTERRKSYFSNPI